jgi:hypothetical protein
LLINQKKRKRKMKKDNIHEDEKRRECLIFNLKGGERVVRE